MKGFRDEEGQEWTATLHQRADADYKGRYHLVLRRGDGGGPEVDLDDVRWNNPRTAQRSLDAMSEVELRRKLRSGLGRAGLQWLP